MGHYHGNAPLETRESQPCDQVREKGNRPPVSSRQLCDAAGLGEPKWYVGAVKLTFCALSLAVPAGMYCFARRHFDETAARIALLAGAFWYELAGFAHMR